jgi:hypothetical protein
LHRCQVPVVLDGYGLAALDQQTIERYLYNASKFSTLLKSWQVVHSNALEQSLLEATCQKISSGHARLRQQVVRSNYADHTLR